MNFVLIEGSFDPGETGYDFSKVIEESKQSDMLALSADTIGKSLLTGIALVEQTVVATSAIKEHVIVLDKRNQDYWQIHKFALLGGCVTVAPLKRTGLSTQLVTELKQEAAAQPGLRGMTGFFNGESGKLAMKLGFSSSCFWLWNQTEVNKAGRTRYNLIFPESYSK